jgi:hypothetical protein
MQGAEVALPLDNDGDVDIIEYHLPFVEPVCQCVAGVTRREREVRGMLLLPPNSLGFSR